MKLILPIHRSLQVLSALLFCSCSLLFERLFSNCESEAPRCDGEVSVQCINKVEFREECDNLCEPDVGLCASCGDGRFSASLGEECDDGNDINTDACTNECRFAFCGDGIIEEGVEECEDGGRCTDPITGNLDPINGPLCQAAEDCESGVCIVVSGDGCSDSCVAEVCGNGIQDTSPFGLGLINEECDDGNTIETDGCTNTCTRDRCGDGLVNRLCIDANNNNDCDLQEQAVSPLEDCDEGMQCIDGSPCTSQLDCAGLENAECTPRGSDTCNPQCHIPFCGDGFVAGVAGELCDDGKQCVTATGVFTPCTTNANCVGVGDGLCANRSGDGCNDQCTTEFCGDGVVNGAFFDFFGSHFFRFDVCDDGNNVDGDGCRADCTGAEVCGDGLLDVNETCDDGNNISGDGCEADCTFICGQSSGAIRASLDVNTGHCYLGFLASGLDDGLDWFGAEDDCEARGGYLAVISSAQENSLARAASTPGFSDVVSGFFHGTPWIGHHDLNNEAFGNPLGFAAITGEPLSFHNFAPGEPNNFGQIFTTGDFGDEDCVQFFNDQLTWNDRDCTNPFQDYICELAPNPCGDGVLQSQLGEQCDDRNTTNGDGCDSACQSE